MNYDKIAVLDFGGQYAHLIANRIRRHGVYSEILDNEISASQLKNYKGIILSGGPQSVNNTDSPKCDPEIFKLGIPILGICYGHQLMQYMLGGTVVNGKTKEYGLAELTVTKQIGIFQNITQTSRVWVSHFDIIENTAEGFEVIGTTSDCPIAGLADIKRNFYGIQFHAEVTHTIEGMKIIDNFLNICKVKRDWNIDQFIEEEIEKIKQKIGNKKVFLLVSGGVDSTVCFALLEKALGKKRVYGLLVDHGLMRLNEAKKVKKNLSSAGFNNLHVAEKQNEFISALAGKADPEEKRKIIGNLFWKVKEDTAEELKLNPEEWIMAQGTIYPDTIETGGTKNADKIKTHHNRVDLVRKMIAEGKVIEPIAQLYKDEVRELGEKLGLPHKLVWRHPFPGPGLGVRILCADENSTSTSLQPPSTSLQPTSTSLQPPSMSFPSATAEESSNTLDTKVPQRQKSESENDKVINFTKLNNQITDYLKTDLHLKNTEVRILPIKSVGVQGDERTYRHPLALFTDEKNWAKLEKISTAITNRFSEVNRVILCIYGKQDNFSIHSADINQNRISVLQKADNTVTEIMDRAPENYNIWQFPVVLAPVSTHPEKESIILRPVASTEAMTASFAEIDWKVIDQLVEAVTHEKTISHIFYDLTHKPPGTIEWE